MGITKDGRAAEKRFRDLVPGAQSDVNKRLGDAAITLDGCQRFVEVKKCGDALGKAGTINQVRPIKFIPCIVWMSARGHWIVIPPMALLQAAAGKNRGQHSELAAECMTVAIPADQPYDSRWLVASDGNLHVRVTQVLATSGLRPAACGDLETGLASLKQAFAAAVSASGSPPVASA